MTVMMAQAARAEADSRGRARCAREHEHAAVERVRGRAGGGPTGGTATEAHDTAREQEHQV